MPLRCCKRWPAMQQCTSSLRCLAHPLDRCLGTGRASLQALLDHPWRPFPADLPAYAAPPGRQREPCSRSEDFEGLSCVGEGRHGGGDMQGRLGGGGAGGEGCGSDPPATLAVLQQPGGQGLHCAPAGATAAHRWPQPNGVALFHVSLPVYAMPLLHT